jgi:ribonuclease J
LSGKLRVLPLGGLGEIGKNMTVLEYEDSIVIVDTGLRFPTAEMPGVDLVLPDFNYLRERGDDIEAIVITHAHEDHVGALPWVLREVWGRGAEDAAPVYGRKLTMAMARSRLDEHKLRDVDLQDVECGEKIEAGPFTLELIHMTHSIPHAAGVAVTCDLGTVLVTGDYKFDQTPVSSSPPDFGRLARLGEEGVLLLCGDSTNADRPGWSPSEAGVGPHLQEVIERAPGRVIVTSFASNVHRVQQVIDAAVALDRKVALVGRSMKKYQNIARSLGLANVPDGVMIGNREMDDFPDEKVVVMSTGSQGEPGSALRRMAHNDHPAVQLHAGDTVVFSATPIPGNERAINETVDRLFRIGCTVVTARDHPIHASGHGYAEEIKLMIGLTRPKYLMPFHGDHKRIRLHGDLAIACGMEPDNIFRGENGLPLEIDADGAKFGEREQSGVIFVDGLDIGDVNDVALRDRRMLSADGIFVVVATIAEQTGQSVAEPEVIFRGVPFTDEAEKLLGDLRKEIERSIARAAKEEIREVDMLEKVLHDDLGAFVYDRLKRRPMVLPVVVEV